MCVRHLGLSSYPMSRPAASSLWLPLILHRDTCVLVHYGDASNCATFSPCSVCVLAGALPEGGYAHTDTSEKVRPICNYQWTRAPAFKRGNVATVGLSEQTYSCYVTPLESRCTHPSVFLHIAMSIYDITVCNCQLSTFTQDTGLCT